MEKMDGKKKTKLIKAKYSIQTRRTEFIKFLSQPVSTQELNNKELEQKLIYNYQNFKRNMSNSNKRSFWLSSLNDDRENLLSKEFNLCNYDNETWQTLAYILRTYMYEVICIEDFLSIIIPKNELVKFFGELIDPVVNHKVLEKEIGFSQKIRDKWIVKFYYDKKALKIPIIEDFEKVI